jgi:hypothetical protein
MAQFIPTPENVRDRVRYAATVADALLSTFAKRDGDTIITQRYDAAYNCGGNEYVYDQSSTATIDGGTVLPGDGGVMSLDSLGVFNGTAGTGRLIAKDQSTTTIYQWGAPNDGTTTTEKFGRAALISTCKTIIWPPGRYNSGTGYGSASNLLTITSEKVIEATGATWYDASQTGQWQYYWQAERIPISIAADVELFSETATFNETDFQVGDVVVLQNGFDGATGGVGVDAGNGAGGGIVGGWLHRATDARVVTAVDGSDLTFRGASNFDYLLSDQMVTANTERYRSVPVTLIGVTCEGNGNASVCGAFRGFYRAKQINCTYTNTYDTFLITPGQPGYGDGMPGVGWDALWCIEMQTEGNTYLRLQEGVRPTGCRSCHFNNTTATEVFQLFLPGTFCSDMLFTNTTMIRCRGGVDAHPSIRTHWHNVQNIDPLDNTAYPGRYPGTAGAMFNLRSAGGSLKNYYWKWGGDEPIEMGRCDLGLTSILQYAYERWPHLGAQDFDLDNVQILNAISYRINNQPVSCISFNFRCGTIDIKNSTIPHINFSQDAWDNMTCQQLNISNSTLGGLDVLAHGREMLAPTVRMTADAVAVSETVKAGNVWIVLQGSIGGGTLVVEADEGSGYVTKQTRTAITNAVSFLLNADATLRYTLSGSTSPSLAIKPIRYDAGNARLDNVTWDRSLSATATDQPYMMRLSNTQPNILTNCKAIGYENEFISQEHDYTTDVWTTASHGLSDDDAITLKLNGAYLPTGYRLNTTYYVVNATTDTFQLSATQGGTPVNATGGQSGIISIVKPNKYVVERVSTFKYDGKKDVFENCSFTGFKDFAQVGVGASPEFVGCELGFLENATENLPLSLFNGCNGNVGPVNVGEPRIEPVGDLSISVNPRVDAQEQIFDTELTTAREITVYGDVRKNDTFQILRSAGGDYPLLFTLAEVALIEEDWIRAKYDGTEWNLIAYSTPKPGYYRYAKQDGSLRLRINGDGNSDGTPDVNDVTSNGYNGTWTGTPGYAAGPAGDGFAIDFDGSSYFTTPTASSPTGAQLTLSFWIKPDSVVVNQRLIGDRQGFANDEISDFTSPKLTSAGHGFADGQRVTLITTGSLPTGLLTSTDYYVVNSDANTFELETSVGNGAETFTDGTESGIANVVSYEFAALTITGWNDSTEEITVASHGYSDGDNVLLTTTGTLPTGLATATNYYIVYVDDDTFKLATDEAGTSIVDFTTGAESGTHKVAKRPYGFDLFLSTGTLWFYDGGSTNFSSVTAAQTFTFDDVADTITIVGHGYVDGDIVVLDTDGTVPAGLSLATDYYVIYVDDDTIQLETAIDAGAIDLTSAAGTGTSYFIKRANNVLIPGEWSHVSVVVNDGTGSKFRINNVQSGADFVAFITPNSRKPLVIGSFSLDPGTNNYTGQLYDIRLYNRSFGLSESSVLYATSALPGVSP